MKSRSLHCDSPVIVQGLSRIPVPIHPAITYRGNGAMLVIFFAFGISLIPPHFLSPQPCVFSHD